MSDIPDYLIVDDYYEPDGEPMPKDNSQLIYELEKRPMSDWSADELRTYNELTGQGQGEPVASPQATRSERICGNCGLPLVQGETEEMCRELDKVAARLEAKRAAQPAAGTTPRSPCDCVMEIASDGTSSIQHDDACQYNIVMEAFARAIWRFFACVSPEKARECRDGYIEEWKNGNRF